MATGAVALHCVQGTEGADIVKGLSIPHAQLIIRKGFNPRWTATSAFIEADGKIRTGLDGYLKGRNIKTVYVVGLATDFCVAVDSYGRPQARLPGHRDRRRVPRHR